jgi:hypothetical protein
MRTNDGVLRRDSAFPTEPLAFRDVGNAVAVYKEEKGQLGPHYVVKVGRLTLMNSQITTVAENDSVRVFPLSVVADLTWRVFRGKRILGLWDHLRLRYRDRWVSADEAFTSTAEEGEADVRGRTIPSRSDP